MIRVILVDDHHITRAGVIALLEREPDIEVVADFDSGRDLLSHLDKLKPDVLLLDMAMPGLSGIEIAAMIHDSGLEIKILVLSAHANYDYVKQMLDIGVSGYLRKDETVEMIAESIRGVARGETGWFSRSSYTALQKTRMFDFTEREIEVIKLLARGHTMLDISETLKISNNTVKTYARRIAKKIGVKSNREIMRWAWEQGFSKQENP
jgi:DNA-binding NarL/FixJ family response regulator